MNNLDVKPEEDGTYLVTFKNKNKLLYDGLREVFKIFGKFVSIYSKENKIVNIKYPDKQSALNCYYELHKDPDFKVELPKKFIKEDDLLLEDTIDKEIDIHFQGAQNSMLKITNGEVENIEHFVRRRRNILKSRAFKRFMIAVSSCNQYIRPREDLQSLMSELKYQLQGVSLNFKTGFSEEIEDESKNKEIPQLILAQDLFYFQRCRMVNAVDVLVSCLPPWFQEVDIYKLILPHVEDDFLGIDWFRMKATCTDECSFPYCIIYLKTRPAAYKLKYCANGLALGNRKISVFLMDDVEKYLIEIRSSLS